jgi:hypothetical protein
MSTTETETLAADIRRARERGRRSQKAGQLAVSARYLRDQRVVMLRLSSGYFIGIPVQAIPELSGATGDQLAQVELGAGGGALHWENLDVDLSVPGLVLSLVPRADRVRELARVAGQSTSERKAVTARLNGLKGGRPKKGSSAKTAKLQRAATRTAREPGRSTRPVKVASRKK